jgi:hypothetical protein
MLCYVMLLYKLIILRYIITSHHTRFAWFIWFLEPKYEAERSVAVRKTEEVGLKSVLGSWGAKEGFG